MIKKLILILLPAFLVVSCSKKEEALQTIQQPVQNQQQVTQPPVQQQTQQQTQTTEQTKEPEKKKEETQKKEEPQKEELKKIAETKQKKDTIENKETSDIDFAPIYAKKCAKCHSKDGRGKSENAPDFTSAKFKQKTDKELYKAITGGIKSDDPDGDDMPSWKGKLTEDEIRASIKFVKSF
ncbi:MAG: c-type cytochrome [Ignavibacteria bacterium]|jgi:cytochrome c5